MICPYCGKELPEYSVFCSSCGGKLPAADETRPSPEGASPAASAANPGQTAAPTTNPPIQIGDEFAIFVNQQDAFAALPAGKTAPEISETPVEDPFGRTEVYRKPKALLEEDTEATRDIVIENAAALAAAEAAETELPADEDSGEPLYDEPLADEEAAADEDYDEYYTEAEALPPAEPRGGPLAVLAGPNPGRKRRLMIGVGAVLLAVLLVLWFTAFSPAARYERCLQKGEACLEGMDWQGALNWYLKAGAVKETPEVLWGETNAYVGLGQPENAIECLEKLAELTPDDADVYAKMADVYIEMGDYRSAIAALDRGIAACGESALSDQLAALLEELGITDYTEEEIAASDCLWAIGSPLQPESQPGSAGQKETDTASENADKDTADSAENMDIDVVAAFDAETGILTITRNGLDSDGMMADFCTFGDDTAQPATTSAPWLALPQEQQPQITEVHILTGVINVGTGLLNGCSTLTTVELGDQIQAVGQAAFANCPQLTDVVFAEDCHLTDLGVSVFEKCGALAAIQLPASITNIGYCCFNSTGLTEIELPEQLITLGNSALNNCAALTKVTVPASVTTLGTSLFFNDKSLNSIEVAAQNANYSSKDGLLYNKSGSTLLRCPQARETVTFSSGLTAVGDRAFYGCSRLKSADLPDGLTSIGGEAFAYCSSLSYIHLPSSLTSIGGAAFIYCPSLSSFALDNGAKNYTLNNGLLLSGDGSRLVCCPVASATGKNSGVVKLPESVTAVADGAFVGCSLTTLVCGSDVATIGASAFADCSNLTTAVLPASVTSIGSGAFRNNGGLLIYCKPGSYAEQYATSAGYQHEAMDDTVMKMLY